MNSKNHQIVTSSLSFPMLVLRYHFTILKVLKLRSQEAVEMGKVQAIVTNLSISVKASRKRCSSKPCSSSRVSGPCQFALSVSFRRFSICLKLFISAGRKSTVTIDEYLRANSAMMSWFRKFSDVGVSASMSSCYDLKNVCSFHLSVCRLLQTPFF